MIRIGVSGPIPTGKQRRRNGTHLLQGGLIGFFAPTSTAAFGQKYAFGRIIRPPMQPIRGGINHIAHFGIGAQQQGSITALFA
jgi:hypothetical protein